MVRNKDIDKEILTCKKTGLFEAILLLVVKRFGITDESKMKTKVMADTSKR